MISFDLAFNPGWDRLAAFESRSGVEKGAIAATVERRTAGRTVRVVGYLWVLDFGPTAGTFECSFCWDADASASGRSLETVGLSARLRATNISVAVVVILIATMAVFSVTHADFLVNAV